MVTKAKEKTVKDILKSGDKKELFALFTFSQADSEELVLLKFGLWGRYFFPKYFTSGDAPFHREIDESNLAIYRGVIKSLVNIAFRGAGKTARTKLFRSFVILNDTDHLRRNLKILSEDLDNAKQIVTDIYNMLVMPRIVWLYGSSFEKTDAKREERMDSFTTSNGIKVFSDTVGVAQRGALAEEARPDEIWYEDFENRTTLRSGKKTKMIWENMEEARTGLAKNGGCTYTCNYISEQGNVHQLVTRRSEGRKLLIIPILTDAGEPTWNRYTKVDIEQMKQEDDDFEGERMCRPSASKDIMFDRETLDKQERRLPEREVAGFKIFRKYDPSHRYGSGHDVAGGVSLDSSTSVFIDFETIPAQVVATFKSNTIKPDIFGDEIKRESEMYGESIAGIEKNNHGHATIARAKQLEVNMYITERADTKTIAATQTPQTLEYGWHTNALTKPKMLFSLAKAIQDGFLLLNDEDLIQEAMSYTRNDLLETQKDPRLTTRHFDLLVACAIAWQMKDFADFKVEEKEELPQETAPLYTDIGL